MKTKGYDLTDFTVRVCTSKLARSLEMDFCINLNEMKHPNPKTYHNLQIYIY